MADDRSASAHLKGDAASPTFAEALKVWAYIGLTSFGGPAGQIAMMHKVLVEQKKWLDEGTYLLALNFCTLLPGPEAMQLATYAGWRLHGTRGGLAAGLLFVVPGALVILVLAALYANFGNVPVVAAIFTSIKAAVLAIVIEALIRIARRSLSGRTEWLIAAASFVAIFFFRVPFPLIVLGAALVGYWRGASAPEGKAHLSAEAVPVPLASTVRTAGIWLAVWILPLLAVALVFGFDHVLTHVAVFFSKLAVVTFGGAYAVAETTPGPLILVTEFVGFLAAARHGGEPALLFGLLGAAVTLWATFAPCFLWVFAGAPYVEWLKSVPKLKSALSAITAAVVGVIFNLSLWFALHVLFRSRFEIAAGPLRIEVPEIASINFVALALGILAAVLLFMMRAGILPTLAASATASLILAFVI
jgi:chromate transporter